VNASPAEQGHTQGVAAVRFCPLCASPLTSRELFGHSRLACPECDFVYFEDPKVATGVVAERNGQILLTKRNHEPKMGCWSFPSGFVDAGEDVRQAAIREALEETGIHVDIERLLGVYQEEGSRVIYIAFAARAGDGDPVADVESMEVRFFPTSELPQLAFAHDDEILAAWRSSPAASQTTPTKLCPSP
jgi:ADP-ribose pyrophosphatase YjhB (NUDIX family)